jgi:hypothetical protein
VRRPARDDLTNVVEPIVLRPLAEDGYEAETALKTARPPSLAAEHY